MHDARPTADRRFYVGGAGQAGQQAHSKTASEGERLDIFSIRRPGLKPTVRHSGGSALRAGPPRGGACSDTTRMSSHPDSTEDSTMSGAHDRAPPERDQSDADGQSPAERYSNVKTPGSLDEDEEEQIDTDVQEMDASEALAGSSDSAEPAPQPDERIEEASTRANAMDHEPGFYAEGNDHAQNMAPASDGATSPSPGSRDDDTDEADGVANPDELDWGEFIHRFKFWQRRRYASRTQLVGAFDCSPQVGGVSAETMLNQAVAEGYIIEQETTGGGYRYHPGAEVDDYV